MLLSLCIVFAVGLLLGGLFRRLKLPALLGMLLGGILAGPYCLNVLDGTLLAISPELRKIALIIILAKAGLALDVKELAKVGRPALLLCFVPASMEILAFTLFAPALLGVSRVEAAMLGAVMGAVSPAVIVPRLTALIEEGWGTEKGIPQMLVAGASADDVYCVVVFYAMLSAAQGDGVSLAAFGKIPLSIAAGILAGIGLGLLAAAVLRRWKGGLPAALVLLMALCFLLVEAERLLDGVFPLSGLIGVMALGMTVHQREKYGEGAGGGLVRPVGAGGDAAVRAGGGAGGRAVRPSGRGHGTADDRGEPAVPERRGGAAPAGHSAEQKGAAVLRVC